MAGETKGPWAIGESAEDMKAWVCVRDGEGWSRAYCADASVAAHIVACVNGASEHAVDRAALRECHMLYSALETRADALAAENERLRGALSALVADCDNTQGIIHPRGHEAYNKARTLLAGFTSRWPVRAARAGKGE